MGKRKVLSIFCVAVLFACVICALPFSYYFHKSEVDLGTYEEFSSALEELYDEYGRYTTGKTYTVDACNIVEIDGEEYVSASALSTEVTDTVGAVSACTVSEEYGESEALVSLSALNDEYIISETEDGITIQELSYTNRIIVYYEGDVKAYNTDSYAEGLGWHIYQYDTQEETQEAYEYYLSLDYLDSVSYDYVVTATDDYDTEEEESATASATSSTYYSWGASYTGVASFTSYLNSLDDELDTVYVAVLDSGVNTSHPILADRISYTYSKDFTGITSTTSGYLFEDDCGHGSHTAGIIANQTTDNVVVISLKVLDSKGSGSSTDIINAIQYILNLNTKYGLDIRVMNMSLGIQTNDGSTSRVTALETVIKNAYNNGVLSVVSAGNSSSDTTTCCPANIKECITVSALKKSTSFGVTTGVTFDTSYSNYGSYIDFSAPGTDIYSAYINTTKTVSSSGTSMAAPHVTAVFALVLSDPTYSQYSNDKIVELLEENATDLGDSGWDEYYGYGCICLDGLKFPTVGEVVFSETEKLHTESFSLTLSFSENSTTGYTYSHTRYNIYYTLDGTTPSTSSTRYTSAITISETTIVTAVYYGYNQTGYNSYELVFQSAVCTMKYYFNNIDFDTSFTITDDGQITGYTGELETLNIQSVISEIEVTSIGKCAFNNSQVSVIILSSTCTEIGSYAFYNNTIIAQITGTGVTEVGAYAFGNCTSLSAFTCENVTSVGEGAFKGTTSYAASINSSKITSVGSSAYYGSGITEVSLSGASIGENAFAYCESLTTATLSSITSLGASAFYSASSLESASITGITTLPSYVFYATGLQSFSSDAITSVSSYAFANCTSLTSVTLENAETLADGAFANCSSLASATFTYVKTINKFAFSGCTSLTYLDIHYAEQIKSYAFNSVSLDTLKLGGNMTAFGAMTNFSVENMYVFTDNKSLVDTYGLYATNLIPQDVEVSNVGDRYVMSESKTATLTFSIFTPYYSSYSLTLVDANGAEMTSGAYLTCNLENVDSENKTLSVTASNFSTGSYFVTVTVTDIFNLSTTSEKLEILVVDDTTATHTLTFDDGNYVVYIDGVQVESGTTLYEGVTYSLSLSAKSGYSIISATVNSENVSVLSSSVTASEDIVVTCTTIVKTTSDVTFNCSSGVEALVNNESVTTATVNNGESLTFVVNTSTGYDFKYAMINGSIVQLTNNSYTINDITEDITVNLVAKIQTFTVTFTYGYGGKVTEVSGASAETVESASVETVKYGSSLAYELTPADGYTISSVTVNDTQVEIDGTALNISSVGSDLNIVVKFAKIDTENSTSNEIIIIMIIAILGVILVGMFASRILSHRKRKRIK